MLPKTRSESGRIEPDADVGNITEQLEFILAELDALPRCEIAALRIDEAINALSDFTDCEDNQ